MGLSSNCRPAVCVCVCKSRDPTWYITADSCPATILYSSADWYESVVPGCIMCPSALRDSCSELDVKWTD